jgi:hypothetical protein
VLNVISRIVHSNRKAKDRKVVKVFSKTGLVVLIQGQAKEFF